MDIATDLLKTTVLNQIINVQHLVTSKINSKLVVYCSCESGNMRESSSCAPGNRRMLHYYNICNTYSRITGITNAKMSHIKYTRITDITYAGMTPITHAWTMDILYAMIKNPAYGRQRISRPMRIVGPIQFSRGCVIYLKK